MTSDKAIAIAIPQYKIVISNEMVCTKCEQKKDISKFRTTITKHTAKNGELVIYTNITRRCTDCTSEYKRKWNHSRRKTPIRKEPRPTPERKICGKCKQEKTNSEFYTINIKRVNVIGEIVKHTRLQAWCRNCSNEYSTAKNRAKGYKARLPKFNIGKICSRCKLYKNNSEFYIKNINRINKKGILVKHVTLQTWCRECSTEYVRNKKEGKL